MWSIAFDPFSFVLSLVKLICVGRAGLVVAWLFVRGAVFGGAVVVWCWVAFGPA